MEISIFLAKVFSLYFLVVGIGMIANPVGTRVALQELVGCPAALYLSAILTLMLGILLIVSHNVWVWGWPLIITVLSWWIFIKGAVRVVYPAIDEHMKDMIECTGVYYSSAIFVLVVGAILFYIGFFVYSM
jgi:hypothetical protein